MTDILTDEIIEIAMLAALPGIEKSSAALVRDGWHDVIRAALIAALPSIVEACAKVAEAHLPAEQNPADPLFKCYKAIEIVVRAIRALIPAP